MFLHSTSRTTYHHPSLLQLNSTPETNGELQSTQSETKLHADLAGLSEPLNLFQTDSPLRELMSFSHLKTQPPAMLPAWDAMVDGYGTSGSTCKTLESSLILATHTHPETESLDNANLLALELEHGRNITQLPLLNQELELTSKTKLKPTDQQKLPSPSMLTS